MELMRNGLVLMSVLTLIFVAQTNAEEKECLSNPDPPCPDDDTSCRANGKLYCCQQGYEVRVSGTSCKCDSDRGRMCPRQPTNTDAEEKDCMSSPGYDCPNDKTSCPINGKLHCCEEGYNVRVIGSNCTCNSELGRLCKQTSSAIRHALSFAWTTAALLLSVVLPALRG